LLCGNYIFLIICMVLLTADDVQLQANPLSDSWPGS